MRKIDSEPNRTGGDGMGFESRDCGASSDGTELLISAVAYTSARPEGRVYLSLPTMIYSLYVYDILCPKRLLFLKPVLNWSSELNQCVSTFSEHQTKGKNHLRSRTHPDPPSPRSIHGIG